MSRKIILLAALLILLTALSSSRTSFGTGSNEPLPNVTEVRIHEVTGLSTSNKEVGGTLEDSGINETFLINQSDNWREYRFTFEVRNDGDTVWKINDTNEDVMFHEGLDNSWEVNKIWYNISQDYDGGTFENGKVDWNTSEGGELSSDELMYAKYLVNISLTDSKQQNQQFKVNETLENTGSYDHHVLDSNKLGWLNLTLHEPPNDTAVTQNETFIFNSSVTCESGECGEVTVSPRYNDSADHADTVIPEESGESFYVNSSNTKNCSSDLLQDETCYVDWFVNSTGDLESWHLLDSSASSSFGKVSGNDSEDNLVQINTALIINLGWGTTEFGTLNPGSEDKPAKGNDDLEHNLTVDKDSDPVDKLWVRSTNLEAKDSDYNISAENMSYSLQNDVSTEEFLSGEFKLVDQNLDPGDILNFFFWIDVPTGKAEGEYNGTMYFKANSTA